MEIQSQWEYTASGNTQKIDCYKYQNKLAFITKDITTNVDKQHLYLQQRCTKIIFTISSSS